MGDAGGATCRQCVRWHDARTSNAQRIGLSAPPGGVFPPRKRGRWGGAWRAPPRSGGAVWRALCDPPPRSGGALGRNFYFYFYRRAGARKKNCSVWQGACANGCHKFISRIWWRLLHETDDDRLMKMQARYTGPLKAARPPLSTTPYPRTPLPGAARWRRCSDGSVYESRYFTTSRYTSTRRSLLLYDTCVSVCSQWAQGTARVRVHLLSRPRDGWRTYDLR